MSEAVELEGCPFCGAALYIRHGVNGYGHCQTERCHANRAQVVALDDPRQIAAWNRRALTKTEGEPVAWTNLLALDSVKHAPKEAAWMWGLPNGSDDGSPYTIRVPLYTRPVWPEGYKLVPIEPTDTMWQAAERAGLGDHGEHHETVLARIWEAMLLASDGADQVEAFGGPDQ